ncbi:MAG: hypothetical protein ACI8RP_001737, partial [Urechidicola sp.]
VFIAMRHFSSLSNAVESPSSTLSIKIKFSSSK